MGLGSPPNSGRWRVGEPRPEIADPARFLRSCHPQAAGPVITAGGPAPRPACGRLAGVRVMLQRIWCHPGEGTV